MTEVCEWFESCERDAYAHCAHPDKGVIPVCSIHVKQFRLSAIALVERSQS